MVVDALRAVTLVVAVIGAVRIPSQPSAATIVFGVGVVFGLSATVPDDQADLRLAIELLMATALFLTALVLGEIQRSRSKRGSSGPDGR